MSKRGAFKQRVIAASVAACFATSGHANPTAPTVAAGSATFAASGNTLTVTNTPGAIINWQQFSIARDEVTRFIQQNAASSVLNRVTGQDPSVILGQLTSNGRVFLINPSGIAFGQGALINVAGLVASTLNISDTDYLSGRLRFVGNGTEGRLTNAGEIRTPAGGHVYLVAPNVENQAGGVITSPRGEIVIAAGNTVELVNAQTPDIRVEFTAPANEAVNAGEVIASSGRVSVYGTLIRNSGRVSASRAEVGEGGRIFFKGTHVALTGQGRLEASGDSGGSVRVEAAGVYVGQDASIAADALGAGNGGDVVLKGADALRHYGAASARAGSGAGGFVETSGGYLELANAPDVGGAAGGTWLIDPYNINIVALGTVNNTGAPTFTPTGNDSQITAGLISGQLNSGTNVVIDTGGIGSPGPQAGDISVLAQIGKSTGTPAATLTLNAARDLNVNAPILIGSGGNLAVQAGGNMSVNSVSVSSVNQDITVGGLLQVRASAPGSSAALGAAGAQNVSAGAIELSAAANANNALITNNATGLQTIQAGSITMSNAPSGGNNSAAVISGGHQQVSTSGDVTLTAGGGAGTLPGVRIGGGTGMATDLQLNVGGTLTINGGAAGNGAGLGSSAAGAPMANNITVNATGDVVLNAGNAAGAGARIGSSTLNGTAGGDIQVFAGGSIRMNGSSQAPAGIRTTGNVALRADAGEITQALNAAIHAGRLSANAAAGIGLGGANQVGVLNLTSPQAVTFNNAGALSVENVSAGTAASLVNAGTLAIGGQVNTGGTLDVTTLGPGADLDVTGFVVSGGAMSLDVAGRMRVRASDTLASLVIAHGGQTIEAGALEVVSRNGPAQVENRGSGNQTILIQGSGSGAGVEIRAEGAGVAIVANNAPGGSQTISVTDADFIRVDGSASFAGLLANSGAQSVSITGGGANALVIGSAGAGGDSRINAARQTILAGAAGEAGSITITGPAGASRLAGILTNGGSGTQTVATSGSLTIQGGSGNPQTPNFGTGIFHNGTGVQAVSAGSVSLQGGGSGANNGAFIGSQSTGAQTLEVAGALSVTGGAGGTSNIGSVFSRASQTIQAGSISLTSGTGGVNNSAAITAPTQAISTTGDVVLSGGTSTGTLSGVRIGGGGGAVVTGTNLVLNVGNDLVMTGGHVENNGAGLGSTASGAVLDNNISVIAGRHVILDEGTAAGARIGYSTLSAPAGGDISVIAGGAIRLNGVAQPTAIRTLGNVTLNSIGDSAAGPNGQIVADTLTANASSGAVRLGGVNSVNRLNATTVSVGSDLEFRNTKSLTVANARTLGNLTLDVAGGLTVAASSAQDGYVESATSQTIRAQSLVVSARDGRLAVLNQSGPGSQSITVTGGSVLVDAAGTGSIAQINHFSPGTQSIAVEGGGSIAVRSDGASAGIFAFNGAQSLSAPGGDLTISSSGAGPAPVFAALGAGTQAIQARSMQIEALGGAFANVNATSAQAISLAGGNLDVVNHGSGLAHLSLNTPGAQTITVHGGDRIRVDGIGGRAAIQAFGGSQSLSITGIGANAITVGSAGAIGASQVTAPSQSVTAGNTGEAGSITVAGSAANGALSAFNTGPGSGSQAISTTGTIRVSGGSASAQASNLPAGLLHNGAGMQTIRAAKIELEGGASGSGNAAIISSFGNGIQANAGDQRLDVSGAIRLRGGSGGVGNRAQISTIANQTISGSPDIEVVGGSGGGSAALPNLANITSGQNRTQTIDARSILVQAGAGGTDNSASITAATQILRVAGDVRVLGGGALGGLSGARIGGLGGANPSPTNLSLTLDGNLLMTGGSGSANSGSSLGSTGASTAPLANNITVAAAGDIEILEGTASGVRIGHASGAPAAGGTISLRAGGAIRLDGSSVAIRTVDGASLTAQTVNGTGGITTGTRLSIDVAGDSLLSGVIAGAGGLEKLGGGTLTLAGSNTYAGDTDIQGGTLALGLPNLTTTGKYNLSAGATLRGSAGTYTNAGVISGDGTLDVAGTSFTNTGTLRPGGSGALGTLTVSGNAVLGATSVIDIEAQGAGASDVLAITGAATLGGSLAVTPVSGYVPATGDTLTPLTYASRSGTLDAGATWFPTYNPADLQLAFDPAINRWIGSSGNWNVAANWSLGHVPLASESVLVDVAGTHLVSVSDGTRFAGRLNAFEDFLVSGGSFSLGGPSSFFGGLSLTGGSLGGSGDIMANGGFTWSGGALAGTGTFLTPSGVLATLAPASHALRLDRTWENRGTIAFDQGSLRGVGVLRNEGTLNKNGTGQAKIRAAFENGASGIVNVNTGMLKLSNPAPSLGVVEVAAGATLRTRGDFVNAGRLSGNGTLDVNGGALVNQGVLAPGAGSTGIGTFTVAGDFIQAASGTLQSGLGGTVPGAYDVLAVTGRATLGGTLETSAVNGYVPSAGDQFRLITYKSRSGEFVTLVAPAGLALDADYMKRFGIFTLE